MTVATPLAATKQPTRVQVQGLALLATLASAVLGVGCAIDVALRFLPADWFVFRAWEAASLYPSAEGPYTPNFIYKNSQAWGDLANLGNLPGFRQFKTEIFTTDAWGYRNSGNPVGEPVRALLVGDSYAVGSGVSDEETLPRRLGMTSGLKVYNGGGRPHDWPNVQKLIRRLNLKGGLVVWEESELWPIPDHVAAAKPDQSASPLDPFYRKFHTTNLLVHNWIEFSPGSILLSRLFRTMQNDRVLPNPRANSVAVRSLQNGHEMLFLTGSVKTYPDAHALPSSYFSELKSLVEATGNELLVVLVPDKYTVYAPLLEIPPAAADSDLYLNRLETRIQANGARVLNLTSTLRAQAAKRIAEGNYNYWIDDTHWNAAGIRAAADQISDYMGETLRLTGQGSLQGKAPVQLP